MPCGDLIGYLGSELGISDESDTVGDVSENPISTLTAVFVLNMASIKQIEDKPIQIEPRVAGNSSLTFDQLVKIVFKINIWICSNQQGFFTSAQKITLLKLAMSNL